MMNSLQKVKIDLQTAYDNLVEAIEIVDNARKELEATTDSSQIVDINIARDLKKIYTVLENFSVAHAHIVDMRTNYAYIVEGYEAYHKKIDTCPYTEGGIKVNCWLSGWLLAEVDDNEKKA